MKQFVFILLLFVLFIGCNNKQGVDTGTVNILDFEPHDDESINLSQLSSSFEIVPLETSEDCLLGENTRIKICQNTIFILTQNSVLLFDTKGKYVSKIDKKGLGPDEYTSITDFDIKSDGNIIIYSRDQKTLFEYDHSATLVSKTDLDFFASNIKLIDDTNIVFLLGNEITGSFDHKFVVMNLSDKSIEQYFPIDRHKAKYLHIIPYIVTSSYNDMLYFFECSNDIVYSIINNQVKEHYRVNFDGKNIPCGFYEQDFSNVMDYAMALMQHGGYAEGILGFFETDNNYFVEYNYKKKCHFAVHNKKNHQKNDFTTIIVDSLFNYPISLIDIEPSACKNKLIIMIQPSAFIQYVQDHFNSDTLFIAQKMVNYTDSEQNPILLIISFK